MVLQIIKFLRRYLRVTQQLVGIHDKWVKWHNTESKKCIAGKLSADSHSATSNSALCNTTQSHNKSKTIFYLRETGACVLFFDFYRNTEQWQRLHRITQPKFRLELGAFSLPVSNYSLLFPSSVKLFQGLVLLMSYYSKLFPSNVKLFQGFVLPMSYYSKLFPSSVKLFQTFSF